MRSESHPTEGWPLVRLKELIKVHHGFAFSGEFFRDERHGDILLTPGNFAIGGGFSWSKRRYYDGPVDERFVLRHGDLIVTMTDLSKASDTLGVPALVPSAPDGSRLLHNQRLGRVEITATDRVDPAFLYAALRTRNYRAQVVAGATGTTVKHTSPKRIGEAFIPLPSLSDQRRVAAVVATLDDKIDGNGRLDRTLLATAQLVYEQRTWSEHSAVSLGDVTDVIDCLHSKKPDQTVEGKPLLQLDNIRDDGLVDLADPFLISPGDYVRWTRRIGARAGDVVITNVGRIGVPARVPDGVTAALGRNMTGIRAKASWPYPTVLILALMSPRMRRAIDLLTDDGTIMGALNVKNIPRLPVPALAPTEFAELEAEASPLWQKRGALLQEARTLRAIRDALLPRLISGETRVPEILTPLGPGSAA